MKQAHDFLFDLSDEMNQMIEKVRRSLVVVQGHRFGSGAGVICQENGMILTNNHVINQRTPRVILPDGSVCQARIYAREAEIDLALLKIEANNLHSADLEQTLELRIGQLVFTLGHPWGQPGFVTAGVLSALGHVQTRGQRRRIPILRIDATLAPGNSGGPLLNAQGQIIGINTMILGGDQGIAISTQVALDFIRTAAPLHQPSVINRQSHAQTFHSPVMQARGRFARPK